MKNQIYIFITVSIVLLGCALSTPLVTESPIIEATTTATTLPTRDIYAYLCGDEYESEAPSGFQLTIHDLQMVRSNCYLLRANQALIVSWDNPPEYTQSVEFFLNCDDASQPGAICRDQAVDWDGSDGF